MRKIKCKLSTIGKAIDALGAYERNLESKNKQMLDEIASVGVDSAQTRFMYAEYDGDYSISVDKEFEDNATVYVVASGESVAFIEFGSGVLYPDEHPNATESWMKHGSWSLSEYGKGHWDDERGWYYAPGRLSHGNPANMCIYNAAREMERRTIDIAKEVFGK